MNQYLLDTNYILRYLLNDIPKQADIAENYFQKAKDGRISIAVSLFASIECIFILTKVYGFEKNKIVKELSSFAKLPYLDIEKRELIIKSLSLYQKTNLGFVDILFLLEAITNNKKLLTFDKKLSKMDL